MCPIWATPQLCRSLRKHRVVFILQELHMAGREEKKYSGEKRSKDTAYIFKDCR